MTIFKIEVSDKKVFLEILKKSRINHPFVEEIYRKAKVLECNKESVRIQINEDKAFENDNFHRLRNYLNVHFKNDVSFEILR